MGSVSTKPQVLMLVGASAVAVCAAATAPAVASEHYRLTVIAEAPDFSPNWGPRGGGRLAINDAGQVAYEAARYVNGGFEGAVFIGDGQTQTLLTTGGYNNLSLFGINNTGQVAFGEGGTGVRLWNQGSLSYVVSDCFGVRISCVGWGGGLGDNTRISATRANPAGGNGMQIVTVGPLNQVQSGTPALNNYYQIISTISRNGLNAASGGEDTSGGFSVWALDPTLIGGFGAFQLCPNWVECHVNGVSINNLANVAVNTENYNLPQYTGYVGVVSTDPKTPGLVRVADGSSPQGFARFVQAPSINNLNEVAFVASTFTNGSGGVFVGDVSGRTPTVVATPYEVYKPDGSTFYGVTQQGFGPHSMNDKGQVAFYALGGAGWVVLRADPAPGVSPGNPILPGPGDELPGGGWRFRACSSTTPWSSTPIRTCPPVEYIDPPVAVGYDYAIENDGPSFRTVVIPAPLPNGDSTFQVEFGGHVAQLKAGVAFDFTSLAPTGVRAFRISGISTDEALDPTDERAFVTGLSYMDPAATDFSVTMIPVSEDAGTSPLAGFKLKSSLIAGCKTVSGTVTLSAPAQATGTVVSISDTLAAATAPLTVKVPAGATIKNFSVKTVAVSDSQSGTVSVSLAGKTLSQPLTLRPMGMYAVTLATSSFSASQEALTESDAVVESEAATIDLAVIGGNPVAGTAKLECKAGPGPILVELSSSIPTVANPTVPSVVVPVGVQFMPFTVTTSPVAVTTKPKITAKANGISKYKVLTVSP